MDESVQALGGFDSELWPESRLAELAGLASAACRRTRLPSMAAATCKASEVAHAASAAAAGFVQARLRICAVASAAVLVACSQIALRSSAVRCGRGRVAAGR
jgi:hypothetical protein